MINYKSCAALNKSFEVTESGEIACPRSQMMVRNSLQKAYIYTNLFFYDLTEREMEKLAGKVRAKRDSVVAASGIAPDDVDNLFPNLSMRFRQEVGDNSFDPIIKLELSKTKKTILLEMTKEEKKQLEQTHEAICQDEILKFKKAVIFALRDDRGRLQTTNNGKPYQVNFSEKYINNLPERCRLLLKPTIKMLAYYDGLQFADLQITPNYVLTYVWSENHPQFDEDAVKEEIKSIIAKDPYGDVY